MNSDSLRDRCTGAFLGFAIGDALGMPAEFLNRELIRQYYSKPISDFIQAHPGHANSFLPPGSYTDNTQTLLAAAECLIECGHMDPARQADAMLSWYRNTLPHRTPSASTLQACKHLALGRPWNKSGVYSSDCSPCMRMIPIGIFFSGNTQLLTRAALDNCTITNTDPKARAASVAVAYLTARILTADARSLPASQVLDTADHIEYLDRDFAAILRWSTQMTHLRPEEALFEIGTSSDVIETIPAAVYCFLKYPKDFSSAVLSAVNSGDAADSIGALSGGFVGLFAGAAAIQKKWAETVENAEVLTGIGMTLADMLGPYVRQDPENSVSLPSNRCRRPHHPRIN